MKDLTIGVVATGTLAAGLVENGQIRGRLELWPGPQTEPGPGAVLQTLPVDSIVEMMVRMIADLADGFEVPAAIGIGFPGIVRGGVVEESPNLRQTKGAAIAALVQEGLAARDLARPVYLYNDADVTAAGLAATRGRIPVEMQTRDERSHVIRVWTLGNGVGFGRYPSHDDICEGGHTVVTLDPKESFCGCGGKGHLEGIVGERAMRLRFMDMEPEEIFARAAEGDKRCCEFEILWHRAIAAATATSIHMDGPGRFYLTGKYARFVQTGMLGRYLHEMVTMSPLQGSVFEVIDTDVEIAVVGAGVNALRSVGGEA
jgi:predicted NBD/HSP70 family sugar kinase